MYLSDSHNFGRRVLLHSHGSIEKPRTIFWEYMFLGNSAFRQAVDHFFRKNQISSPFRIFPYLSFQLKGDSGIVEKLTLDPVDGLNVEEAHSIGSAIALLSWFGIIDLNSENLMIGRRLKKLLLAPIDIEAVGVDIEMLDQMSLIPSSRVPDNKCGIRPLVSFLRRDFDTLCAPLCHGFIECLSLCISNEQTLDQEFVRDVSIENPRIRVIFRKTGSYLNYINGVPKPREFEIPPFASEIEQMSRGDIPYYFKYGRSDTIFHFESPGHYVESDMNTYPNKIPYRQLLDFPKNRLNKNKLLAAGALQICRAILPMSKNSQSTYEGCQIEFSGPTISINFKDQFRWRTTLKAGVQL